MRCPVCGRALAVAAEFIEARTEDEITSVYSALDLMCTNPSCPNGRLGLPVKRVRRPLLPERGRFGSVSCCGIPLLYLNDEGYTVPGGVAHRRSGRQLALTCPQCGKRYLVDVAGKTDRTPSGAR